MSGKPAHRVPGHPPELPAVASLLDGRRRVLAPKKVLAVGKVVANSRVNFAFDALLGDILAGSIASGGIVMRGTNSIVLHVVCLRRERVE